MRFTKLGRLGAVLIPLGMMLAGCSRQPTAPVDGATSRDHAAMAAATTSTLYLHGSGPLANPSELSLDGLAPSATTVRFKDSPGVRFAGGNAWVEIGRWSAPPSLSRGSLTSLGDVMLWLGLKNSDDIGTNFDVRAEVYSNGALVASGESQCISGITRNPSLAKAVGIAFGTFAPVAFDGSTQVLSLRLLARIGTNASGGSCGGHASAVGLRSYFDAVSRPASFTAAFTQGAHVSVTVVEDKTFAPVAGATVRLEYIVKQPPKEAPKGPGDPPVDPNVFTGVTDANGLVEFADQRVGEPVVVSASDAFGRTAIIKQTSFAEGENSLQLLFPAVKGGILRGLVTTEGSGDPIRSGGISVINQDGFKVATASLGPDGRYETASIGAGTYAVEIGGSGHEPLRVEGVVIADGQVTELNASLVRLPPPPPMATLTLVVVDANGNRVGSVTVRLDLADGTSMEVVGDSVGNVPSFDLAPQLVTVTATAPDGATASTTLELPAGSTNLTLVVQ